jgi:membrane protein DedA with SNARE-associated domain
MEQWVGEIMTFIGGHRSWAGPVVCALAFAESMAFLSLLVPFTATIVASGTLIGTGALDPWVIVPWGVAGACLGDAVSYWIGRYFGDRVPYVWPFKNDPALLEQGRLFFLRWGALSVLLGRFFGPLRAIVPIVAGMMGMSQTRFQIANIASAVIWLPALMLPGAIAGTLLHDVADFGERAFVYVLIAFVVLPLAVALVLWLRRRKRA